MRNYILFLRWWLVFTLIIVSTVFIYYSGFFNFLYEKDRSYLSFVILSLFYFMSVWCGVKTWCLSHSLAYDKLTDDTKNLYARLEENGWFYSEQCLTIGMIGTVWGFILMLGNFSKVDIANMTTVQDLITELGLGMSTALLTTLTGLVCSMLLKLQYFNLSQANLASRDNCLEE